MDLLTDSDIQNSDSGTHTVPESILDRLHPGVKLDASKAFAEMVQKYPDYHISMVRDGGTGDLIIYWNRVA